METLWLTAEPFSQLGGCGSMGREAPPHVHCPVTAVQTGCHRLSVSPLVSGIFWLHACTVGGSGHAASTFIYVNRLTVYWARYEQEVTTWKGHFYTMATSNNLWCHMANKYRKGDTHTHARNMTWHDSGLIFLDNSHDTAAMSYHTWERRVNNK